MKNEKKLMVVSFVGLVIFLALSFGCDISSGPQLEVLSKYIKGQAYTVNGETDWGYEVKVRVRNNGGAGSVRAIVELYIEQDKFYEEQMVDFAAGQEQELSFVFIEPAWTSMLSDEVKYEFRSEKQ